jgi:hypothetical protein
VLVFLTTQEAEIRRITVPSHPRNIVLETPILKKLITEMGWWNGSSGRAPAK